MTSDRIDPVPQLRLDECIAARIKAIYHADADGRKMFNCVWEDATSCKETYFTAEKREYALSFVVKSKVAAVVKPLGARLSIIFCATRNQKETEQIYFSWHGDARDDLVQHLTYMYLDEELK